MISYSYTQFIGCLPTCGNLSLCLHPLFLSHGPEDPRGSDRRRAPQARIFRPFSLVIMLRIYHLNRSTFRGQYKSPIFSSPYDRAVVQWQVVIYIFLSFGTFCFASLVTLNRFVLHPPSVASIHNRESVNSECII